MKKIIVDIENGTETIEDLTEEELQKVNEKLQAEESDEAAKAAARADLLAKLGINEDEAKLLLS